MAAVDQLTADALYNLACVLSLCAAAVKDDAGLAEQYAARSLKRLKHAQVAGFFNVAGNVEHLGKDTDLDALRERDDFRQFVEQLKTGSEPRPE